MELYGFLIVFSVLLISGTAQQQRRTQSDVETGEKSGICPKPEQNIGICMFDPNKNCIRDEACPRNQKCCVDGCNKICKDPLDSTLPSQTQSVVKLGSCPKSQGIVGVCSYDPKKNCLGDNACPRNQKCCSDGCNKICKDPLDSTLPSPTQSVVKLGSCPKSQGIVGVCSFDPKKNCLGDNACPRNQKCCSDGCNKICKDPAQSGSSKNSKLVKTGACPKSDGAVGICNYDPSRNCINDRACSGNLKCCADGCGKTCKAPVLRRSRGRCPETSGHPGVCEFGFGDLQITCQSNNDCDLNKRCCADNPGCKKACVQPVFGRSQKSNSAKSH